VEKHALQGVDGSSNLLRSIYLIGEKMNLPIVGNTTKDENNRTLEVVRVFKNNSNYMVVEYEDRNGLRGCVLPEYWWKKSDDYWKRKLRQLDGQAGSEAPS
jgi:hypothetical protein